MSKKATLDHYQILEVSADADAKTIDAAYWRLARESASGTRAALADLNAAYELLGSPSLRERYDAGRLPQARAQSILRPEPKARTPEKRLPEATPHTRPSSLPPQLAPATVDPRVASLASDDQRAYVELLQLQVRQSRASLRARLASLPATAEDAGRSPLQRIFGRVRSSTHDDGAPPASRAANAAIR